MTETTDSSEITAGAAPDSPAGRIGPYRLLREIGRGGTATVYEAVDDRSGRVVALKALHPNVARFGAADDPDATARPAGDVGRRLEREARALARLSHPNVARVLDVGSAAVQGGLTDETVHYLALEKVEGETLRDRLRREGRLSPAVAAAILEQVAAGLDAVHAAGVVHRDIKPSNILLEPGGGAKIADFGIARLADAAASLPDGGVVVGSPHYVSPEQAQNQPVTPASDLWSLAVVLYEMLAGRVPFTGRDIPAILREIVHGGPPPMPDFLPPAAHDVLTRALARNPALRFPDAVSFASEFGAALAAAPARNVGAAFHPASARITAAPRRPRPAPTARRDRLAPVLLFGGAALAAVGATFFAFRMHRTAASTSSPTQQVAEAGGGSRVSPPVSPARTPPAAATRPKQPVPPRPAASPVPNVTPTPIRPVMTVAEKPALDGRTAPAAAPQPQTAAPLPPAAPLPTPTPPPLAAAGQTEDRDVPAAEAPPLPTAPAPASGGNDDPDAEPATDPLTQLAGTWRGTYGGRPATLVVEDPDMESGRFKATLIVQTAAGEARVNVAGVAADDGGVSLRATKVTQAPASGPDWKAGGIDAGSFDEDSLVLKGTGRAGGPSGPEHSWEFRR